MSISLYACKISTEDREVFVQFFFTAKILIKSVNKPNIPMFYWAEKTVIDSSQEDTGIFVRVASANSPNNHEI